MRRVFYAGLEVMAAAVVLVPIFLILNKTTFHDRKKSVLYCLFSFYLAAVCVLVGIPNITYIRLEWKLNLIPFVGMLADLKNSLLNILLFVPVGLFLPILWDRYEKMEEAVLFGFGLSLLIEVLQIFTYRATDVNDLITNTLGTVLGFLIAGRLIKSFPAVHSIVKEKKNKEVYIVSGIAFGVMFFVHPFLSSLMWAYLL